MEYANKDRYTKKFIVQLTLLYITRSLGLAKLSLYKKGTLLKEYSKTEKHKAEMRFRTSEHTLYKQNLFKTVFFIATAECNYFFREIAS